MSEYKQYSVRYLAEESVVVIELGFVDPEFAVEIAAGNLFLNGWSPGEDWCVYENDERQTPVLEIDGEKIDQPYYGDYDYLWPENDSAILRF